MTIQRKVIPLWRRPAFCSDAEIYFGGSVTCGGAE
jgi:hypothetical protein